MDHAQYTGLLAEFKALPDPRKRRGQQHAWLTIWTLILSAMASACVTPTAIARWIMEHQPDVLQLLPPHVSRLPGVSTIRRALALVDVARLEQVVAAWPPRTAVDPPMPEATVPLRAVALDGKALRGVGRDGHPCHVVSIVDHQQATVLDQVAVAAKRDERSAVPALLGSRSLAGQVITLDALHTQRATARLILEHGGQYLMIVKKNQSALYEYLDMLFTLPAHPADKERWDQVGPHTIKGHGRLETRTLRAGNAHIEDVDWPGVQQVVWRQCERTVLKTGKTTREVTYGLVSVPPEAAPATTIEDWWRGHWTIENRVHYVRDVTLGEDAGHAAAGNTAHVLATVRNALLGLFRHAGWRSIPDALAHYGASVRRALTLVGLKVNT